MPFASHRRRAREPSSHATSTGLLFQNRAKFAGLLESSRRKSPGQLGVTADEIALVRNTSEANNTINNGLALKSGDEIVLWDQNHPTNNVAWDVRAKRFGLSVVRRLARRRSRQSAKELVEAFVTPSARRHESWPSRTSRT